MHSTHHIENTELESESIPQPDAPLRDIGRFAGTFQIDYNAESQTFLKATIKNYIDQGVLPDSLTELRSCLALEWTILPYVTQEPNARQEQFLRDLVRGIRDKIAAKEIQ